MSQQYQKDKLAILLAPFPAFLALLFINMVTTIDIGPFIMFWELLFSSYAISYFIGLPILWMLKKTEHINSLTLLFSGLLSGCFAGYVTWDLFLMNSLLEPVSLGATLGILTVVTYIYFCHKHNKPINN